MWQQIRYQSLKIAKAFSYLVYPPICPHCNEGLKCPDQLLCDACLTLLSLIDPQERCPVCFGSDYQVGGKCGECLSRQAPMLTHRLAAAFDYAGPAKTLVKQFKYSNKPYLTNLLASYLVAQFCALQWPLPDAIIPVPMPWTHLVSRGYNQSALLAKEMAHMLGTEYREILKRSAGDYSQAGLSIHQRKQLSQTTWSLKENLHLYDQTVLLIDDVMTTGSTLMRCAETLSTAFPESIYGLTVCRVL